MTEDEAKSALLDVGVSRETLARLATFAALLAKWTRKINLIAPASVADIWSRHILDCAQIGRLGPINAPSWVDLGSGGGLPGLVIAALRQGENPELRTTLIDSDQRKCAFLHTAAREMGVDVDIQHRRIETTPDRLHEVVSARALAPLDRLLALAVPYGAQGARWLFLKGAAADAELTSARKTWHMEVVAHPSVTDPAATILEVRKAARRHERDG